MTGDPQLPPVTQTDSTLVVRFAPRRADKILVALLVLVGLQAAFFAARAITRPMSTLTCDRGAGACVVHWQAAVSSGTFSFAIAGARRTEVVMRAGGPHWVVTMADRTVELSDPGAKPPDADAVGRAAAQLQAFLADPSRRTFSLTFDRSGTQPSWVLLLVVSVVALLWAVRWIRGWYAELTFDRAAGTLAIDRRPMLLIGAGQQTIPLAEVGAVERSKKLFFINVPIAIERIVVRGRGRKVVFGYRMLANTPVLKAAIAERYKAIDAFIHTGGKSRPGISGT